MRDWPNTISKSSKRAIFLDRDGTINVDTHYPHKISDLKLIPKTIEAFKILSKLNLPIIVVSNQSGIGQGLFTKSQMNEFNAKLREIITKSGGRFDAFYYCPDIEKKYEPSSVIENDCSKPNPGMLIEAAKDFRLNLTSSFIVGDKISDIAAGDNVGCKTILVKTGKAGKDDDSIRVKPDFIVEDLYNASLLLKHLLKTDS